MKSTISENAHSYFTSGFNCAEAVFRAVIEQTEGVHESCFRMATPFGGGVGGSHEELCGALAGGVMAVGYLAGRTESVEDASPSKTIAAQLRDRFIQNAKCTRCQTLLDQFGAEHQKEQCALLVSRTAEWVADLLEEQGLLT